MPLKRPAQMQKWVTLTGHRTWLAARANDLLDFFEGASIDPAGGFRDLDDHGRPLGERRRACPIPARCRR